MRRDFAKVRKPKACGVFLRRICLQVKVFATDFFGSVPFRAFLAYVVWLFFFFQLIHGGE